MQALAAALIAAFGTVMLLRLMLRSGVAALAPDRAGDRSLHSGVIPRIGGLGLAMGAIAGLTAVGPQAWPPGFGTLAASVAVILAISLIDDLRGLPAAPRLLAHLCCAAALCWSWDLPPVWWLAAAPGIAWSANLYNFMDGSDGLAGAMTAVGYGVLGAAAWTAGSPALATLCAAVAGAACGFLTLNWHPARVFLGDAGSVPLGFGAAAIGLHGAMAGDWPAALPAIAFLPFVTDASVTLALRAMRGARLAEPHREHLYQRLALAGHGHRWVARRACGWMVANGAAALSTLMLAPVLQAVVFALATLANLGLWIVLDRRLRRAQSSAR
jgi:UDP-N-acetylmuramyl pentapeptide phosphotransferase/UDP-N-acetylglucosamine-1-phosphate transferase